MTRLYHVTWEIDIDAQDARSVAQMALDIQRDVNSLATVFKVTDTAGDTVCIDLSDKKMKPEEAVSELISLIESLQGESSVIDEDLMKSDAFKACVAALKENAGC